MEDTPVFPLAVINTLLPGGSQRPATPSDTNFAPQQERLFTELIMDGRIPEDNLKRTGLDHLAGHTVKQSHIHSPQDVFLAVRDRNPNFVRYEEGHIEG